MMLRRSSTIVLLLAFVAACAPNDRFTPAPDAPTVDSVDMTGDMTGDWTGQAVSHAGQFIRGGTFTVHASFAHAGDAVIGFFDVRHEAAPFAEYLGFRAKGTIDAAGVISLDVTDRICGAGEPDGLCYPGGTAGNATFRAGGRIRGTTLTIDTVEPLRAMHDNGAAVEKPFETLSLTHDTSMQIVGMRTGYGRAPRSEFYPLPLPLLGKGTMTIETSDVPRLIALEWEGETYVPPPNGEAPVVLADSFRFDPATNQYWFLQVSSIYSRYVYVGKQYGDELRGAIWSEDLAAPDIYTKDAPPVLFTEPKLPSLIGTFNFPSPATTL